MAKSSSYSLIFLLICAAMVLAATSPATSSAEGNHNMLMMKSSSSCNGTIGECTGEEKEFEMDSLTNRRMLANSKYIGYGPLRWNSIPCSRNGNTSQNCKPGPPANPYKRGCNPITGCRGG